MDGILQSTGCNPLDRAKASGGFSPMVGVRQIR